MILNGVCKQNGNALFLILIAVALFAALSYAITSSGRGSGNIDREKLQLEITAIEDYLSDINFALQKIRVVGGFQYWQMNFRDNQSNPHSNAGPNSACGIGTNDCSIFETDGGPIIGYRIPTEYLQIASECSAGPDLNSRVAFVNVAIAGVGQDSERDFALRLGGANDALCMAVNDKYDIPNNGSAPPSDATNGACGSVLYSGSLTSEVTTSSCVALGDEYVALAGRQMFCAKNFNGCNHIYSVVMSR